MLLPLLEMSVTSPADPRLLMTSIAGALSFRITTAFPKMLPICLTRYGLMVLFHSAKISSYVFSVTLMVESHLRGLWQGFLADI